MKRLFLFEEEKRFKPTPLRIKYKRKTNSFGNREVSESENPPSTIETMQ
jgi:hypothetical protein